MGPVSLSRLLLTVGEEMSGSYPPENIPEPFLGNIKCKIAYAWQQIPVQITALSIRSKPAVPFFKDI